MMMIKSQTRWWRIISIIINVGKVAIVIDTQLCGLQMSKRICKVTGISVRMENRKEIKLRNEIFLICGLSKFKGQNLNCIWGQFIAHVLVKKIVSNAVYSHLH